LREGRPAISTTSTTAVSLHVQGRWRQLLHLSQFLYRYTFAYLLFLYLHTQGVNPGFLLPHEIAIAQALYVLAVAAVQFWAAGKRLSVAQQRAIILIDLAALIVGVPHDPHDGLPTLFVFYLAYADLALRHRYQLYLEAVAVGLLAFGTMLYLRAFHTVQGLSPTDAWQVFLLAVIVLHGLQVVAGRDRSRREILDATRRLQLALHTPGLGSWSSDDPVHELKIDGHIQQVLGLDRKADNHRMATYLELIHPQDLQRVRDRYLRFLQSSDTDYEDQYRVVRPDGAVRHISSRAQATRDERGVATQVAGLVWDLTEQIEQQRRLERVEDRYRLATTAARVAVWVWHVIADRFEHDSAINRLMNLPDEARATRLADVLSAVHPDDAEPFRARIEALLASEATEFSDEVRIRLPDGRIRYMQTRAVVDRDHEGRPIRLAGANWDATGLAEARIALERSHRELDDFTYIASHDLKEPLRGIASFAAFLEQDYGPQLDEEGRQMVERIRTQALRMQTLIQDLLELSRLGRVELWRETIDCDALLRDIADSIDFTLREKGVELRIPEPLPTLRCDRVRIGEVFRNLLTNAAKYNTAPAPWIEVRCTLAAGEAGFSVRDNGIGIAPEHQARVFAPFERLHHREAYGGGSGIGLSIVQKIIQMHGGRVWLESTPGQGSTFHFTLPQAAET
jgi:PAS domain S-box-containing protein